VIAIFTAGGIALLIAGFGTPILLRWLTRKRIGQQIREELVIVGRNKVGTPTMGGIAMIVALVLGYVLGHVNTGDPFTRGGWLVVITTSAAAVIGLVDDWISARNRRSLGLNKRAKLIALVVVALGFALASVYWVGVSTTLSFTRYDLPGNSLGTAGWVVWAVLIIVAASNAANLTDGMDGLAAGSSAFAFTCFAFIGYWQLRNPAIYIHNPYHLSGGIDYGLDLGVAAVSMAGACIGFLWWNAAPARIFMGDTGSLAIGTCLACLALLLNTQLLLLIIGGLLVVETLSVLIQVVSYRVFHHRVFRMAPLHHHFELAGWPETTVIVRFWIFAGLCAALGLGIFYADFLSVGSPK
jgi:phospho-N-acetylmuramoyl-pentapeptide-transferase